MSAPLTIWRRAFDIGEEVANWERFLGTVHQKQVEGELQRAQSQPPPSQPKSGSGKDSKLPSPKLSMGKWVTQH